MLLVIRLLESCLTGYPEIVQKKLYHMQGVGENCLMHAMLKVFSAGKFVLHRHDSR
jgi:hypothetical protein